MINRYWRAVIETMVGFLLALMVATVVSRGGGEAGSGGDAPRLRVSGGAVLLEQASNMVFAAGSDRLPNLTAEDWVSYSDYVVLVTAVSEKALPPTLDDRSRGEGMMVRGVRLKVEDVLWSSSNPDHLPPTEWTRPSMGWTYKGGSADRPMALVDTSRVEVGHAYIMAIDWVEGSCNTGRGEWLGLGAGAVVPADGGVVGAGEYEGAVYGTPDTGTSMADALATETSLRRDQWGNSIGALTDVLSSTTPLPRDRPRAAVGSTCVPD